RIAAGDGDIGWGAHYRGDGVSHSDQLQRSADIAASVDRAPGPADGIAAGAVAWNDLVGKGWRRCAAATVGRSSTAQGGINARIKGIRAGHRNISWCDHHGRRRVAHGDGLHTVGDVSDLIDCRPEARDDSSATATIGHSVAIEEGGAA